MCNVYIKGQSGEGEVVVCDGVCVCGYVGCDCTSSEWVARMCVRLADGGQMRACATRANAARHVAHAAGRHRESGSAGDRN